MNTNVAVKKAKVLVVDDDPIVLRPPPQILTREGYQVVAIDDAVEGARRGEGPDLRRGGARHQDAQPLGHGPAQGAQVRPAPTWR